MTPKPKPLTKRVEELERKEKGRIVDYIMVVLITLLIASVIMLVGFLMQPNLSNAQWQCEEWVELPIRIINYEIDVSSGEPRHSDVRDSLCNSGAECVYTGTEGRYVNYECVVPPTNICKDNRYILTKRGDGN